MIDLDEWLKGLDEEDDREVRDNEEYQRKLFSEYVLRKNDKFSAKRAECYPAFYLVLNHPTFNQIKKRHGINYSDKFYIRLLYAVSFVLSY